MDQITDFALGKLSPERSLQVLEEMERDPAGSRRLDVVADMVRLGTEHGDEIFQVPAATSVWSERVSRAFRRPVRSGTISYRWARPVLACMILLALAAILEISSEFSTSRYYALTTIDRLALEQNTRGQGGPEYAAGCGLVSRGKYTDAIRTFERFLRAYPENDLRYVAEYSLGATYLLAAHRSVGPFFPSYDVMFVVRGLGHLQQAAGGARNRRVVEEAHWLRAKGFLMLSDRADALAELDRVIAMGGPKTEEAKRLSAALAGIEGD